MQSSPEMQGFRLPENPNPPLVCVQLQIPNDPAHIAAFLGVLYDLTLWNSWQRDAAHTGSQAARIWKAIWVKLTSQPFDCNTANDSTSLEDLMSQQIRISPDNPCIIQQWCIDHWEDWYNPTDCVIGAATQPPPAGAIPSGDCVSNTYNVPGNSRMLLPVPLKEGNIVSVSRAVGGTWDGDVLHAWQCPNGYTYALGACVSAGPANAAGPIPTLPYGKLIFLANGIYYDILAGPVTIPSGTPDTDGYFQINDAVLGDNEGSLTIDVSVCNNEPTGFTHVFDFGLGPNGWTGETAGGVTPSWDGSKFAGAQFISGGCGGNNNAVQCQISKAMPAPRYIRTIRVVGLTDSDWGPGNGARLVQLDGATQISLGVNGVSGVIDVTVNVLATVSTSIEAWLNSICFAGGVNSSISKIVVVGDGTDPF